MFILIFILAIIFILIKLIFIFNGYDSFINKNINKNIHKNINNYQNSLFIIDNFYKSNDFKNIIRISKNHSNNLKFDERIQSRKTICFKDNVKYKKLYNLVYNDTLKDFINKIDNRKIVYPSFPIEYRKYENKSSGMNWHKDLALYNNEYYEAVLTLENYSDSYFEFIHLDKIHRIKTKPNMLILVKPNTILHRVTPLSKGYRTILKFVITFSDNIETNVFLENYEKCPK